MAFVQALGLFVFGLLRGYSALHSLGEATIVLAPIAVAVDASRSRGVRAVATSLSLMLASVMLVHMAGGVTEAHFHFFVMIGVVALYQEWAPYLVGIAVVVVHHGVLGTIDPKGVFGTAAAQTSPWKWAAIHGGFVVAASLASLIAWRLNEQQAMQDPLTNVGNRTKFAEALERRANDPDQSVSVVFVDLDQFKMINDTRGHQVGDAVLRIAAERLSQCARRGDVVARFGGDEFAVLVNGDAPAAHEVAERFERALTEPFLVDGHRIVVGASIGVAASIASLRSDPDELLRNADLAMFEAKALGKSRIVVFGPELGEQLFERGRLQFDLAHALDRREFSLVYQPLVDLRDRSVVGCEALLRWNHPFLGNIPPDVFIPLAEDTRLIAPLGEWVLRQALHDVSEWQFGPDFTMAVNLSPQQLLDAGLVDIVRDALASSGWPANRLILEITETAAMTDLTRCTGRLGELRALGIEIAIDDFGTGYSSLSYLRDLPIDIVKIDRSFVATLIEDPRSATLLRGIVTMTTGLGLGLVAEGVETEAQAAALQALECRFVQGHLFARPMTAAELTSGVAPWQIGGDRRPFDAARRSGLLWS